MSYTEELKKIIARSKSITREIGSHMDILPPKNRIGNVLMRSNSGGDPKCKLAITVYDISDERIVAIYHFRDTDVALKSFQRICGFRDSVENSSETWRAIGAKNE